MADLLTTVESPIGPVYALHGRVPKEKAISEASAFLRHQIAEAQAHLAELDNWTTSAARGRVRAKTYEEVHGGND